MNHESENLDRYTQAWLKEAMTTDPGLPAVAVCTLGPRLPLFWLS